MNYVDLFAGAGGFSLGFEKAGFKNLFAIEFDETIAKTYKRNFPNNNMIIADIKAVDNKTLKKLVNNKEVDIVVGGPPCQGFSLAGNIGRTFVEDERNSLFKEFLRVVDILKPKMFIMENVSRMKSHNKGKTILEIKNAFENIGYKVDYQVLQASNYNVPQNRSRIFIVGTRELKFNFPTPSSKIITVKEAIDDLPPLKNGEKSTIPNHFAMKHSEQMLKKMSYITDGGNREMIPESIRPKSGDIRKYIKYDSTKPSVTVTGDMRKIFHYSQNRALSPRELARLQSFPDDFIFEGNSISIQQQIGNAVPPNLAYEIAKMASKTLSNDNKNLKNPKYPKVNYIGNKEKLSEWIVNNLPIKNGVILDIFSGGNSVSYELKKRGFKVYSNDVLFSSYVISKAIIENSSDILDEGHIDNAVKITLTDKERERFTWLENRLFFKHEVDELAKLVVYSENMISYQRYIFQSLIRRAMIRKLPYSRMNVPWNNIVKLRDEEYSYEKYGRRRAYHNQSFSYHMRSNLLDYNNSVFDNSQNNKSFQEDALNVLDLIENVNCIYLDPPYPGTMNKYEEFYSSFDVLFGKKKKFTNLSDRNNFLINLENIIEKAINKTQYIVLSINSNSNPGSNEIISIFEKYGKVSLVEKKHNYQVSGKLNKNTNLEQLIILDVRTI